MLQQRKAYLIIRKIARLRSGKVFLISGEATKGWPAGGLVGKVGLKLSVLHVLSCSLCLYDLQVQTGDMRSTPYARFPANVCSSKSIGSRTTSARNRPHLLCYLRLRTCTAQYLWAHYNIR